MANQQSDRAAVEQILADCWSPDGGLLGGQYFDEDKATDAILSLLEKARVTGASIAAQEINRKIGVQMATNGDYYLLRHAALSKGADKDE